MKQNYGQAKPNRTEPHDGNAGGKKQSGPTATRGTKYYMPETDEEVSAAEKASENEGPKMASRTFRNGGFNVKDINKKVYTELFRRGLRVGTKGM